MRHDFGLGRKTEALIQPRHLAGLDFVHVVIAAQQQQPDLGVDDFARLVGLICCQHQRFDRGLQWHTQKFGHIGASAFAGRWCHLHTFTGRRACLGGRQRLGLFHIGGIAAAGAVNDGVFARGGNHLKFFAQIAANGATIGRYGAVVEAKAVKNAAVGLRHVLVAELGAFHVLVKAVGVFHDEFAPAHQAKAGAAFVAEFGLNLVQVFGQLLVAAQILSGDVSDHFFAGGLNHKGVVVPILNAQQLGPHTGKAAGFLPQLGRLHNGHGALNGAGAVHFFAHDGFYLANDAQAQRHIGVNACAQPFDETGAHHQLVADDFGVGGRFAQGGEVKL